MLTATVASATLPARIDIPSREGSRPMPDTLLDYAPPPPMHRRRRFRHICLFTIFTAFIASAWWWAPPAWRRIELLYWQHKCMVYQPPPDQIVADPATGTKIIPAEWSNFYSLLSPPGFRSDGTVFLHQLKTPDGKLRLVAVDSEHSASGDAIGARVIIPGTILRSPEETSPFVYGQIFFLGETARITAGKVDPQDPSHFSFSANVGRETRLFEGWLNQYGVSIDERRPATK